VTVVANQVGVGGWKRELGVLSPVVVAAVARRRKAGDGRLMSVAE
jgi:hypothetical protein